MRRAASPRTSLACCGAMVHSFAACSWIAATTLGCWWPMLVFTSCDGEVQVPVAVAVPEVGALGRRDRIGLSAPWADQEWKTCARSRA